MAERTVGVEEELLLVDPGSGRVRAVAQAALAAHRDLDGTDAEVGHELFRQQIETATQPCHTSDELLDEVVACRRAAAAAAEAAGAALVAVGTSVLPLAEQRVTPNRRYEHIVDEFGEIGRQAGVCGMHVHVLVADDDEAVRVVDAARPWLPVLRALSGNSPYWQGRDTGYSSWRSQVWGRFPTAGPAEPYGDPAGYATATRALIDSGAALDEGMLYLDARLSRSYPTVEFRVFDVLTDVGDVVLLALVTRALVTTIADEGGGPAGMISWRVDRLRAAHWLASRYGVTADLLDPRTGARRDARDVVDALIQYVEPALRANGEDAEATRRLQEMTAHGSGSARQRAAAEASGTLEGVVTDLRDRFTWSLG